MESGNKVNETKFLLNWIYTVVTKVYTSNFINIDYWSQLNL